MGHLEGSDKVLSATAERLSMESRVFVERCARYDAAEIEARLRQWESMFSERIRPGQLVVIKPNWIAARHKYRPDEWTSVITHPSIVTAVLKLTLEHLRGRGRVVITDGPQTDSSWANIMAHMTPRLWIEMGAQHGVPVEVLDLRDSEWTVKGGVNVRRTRLQGDPRGSTHCDLREASEFADQTVGHRGYYGADYDVVETNQAHTSGRHRYMVSRTVMESDVFINLPKLKTHKKAGITCALKNLVGINTNKNLLPHYRLGTPIEGGDEFLESSVKNKTESLALAGVKRWAHRHERLAPMLVPLKYLGKAVFGDTRDVVRGGNWHGNDTVWRMVIDLNKVLLYADPDGTVRRRQVHERKSYLTVVDGIVAGEGNGPEAPDPKAAGLLVAGTNPATVDAVCCKLMGFDWQRVPVVRHAFGVERLPICPVGYTDVELESSEPMWRGRLTEGVGDPSLRFRPHFGWLGHIEL